MSRCPCCLVPVNLFRQFSQEFRVNWQGSVLAPETGEYEFVVRTENAVRLWVNDNGQAADRRLGEVGQRHRVSRVDLPAGRAGLSAAAGVVRGARRRRSSIELLWKVPRTGLEVIPQRNLSPGAIRRRPSCCRTPFPPDDRSVGYERGTSVSKAWDQATTDAALEVADYVVGPPQGPGRGRRRRRDKDREREAPRVLPAVRRAGVPAAARRTSRRRSSSTASSRRAATRRRPSSGSCCWSSSRRGSSIASSAPARRTPSTWRRGSRSGSGTRSPTSRCWRPPPPASSPAASRSPAGRAHGRATCAPAPSSASSSSSGCRVDQVPEIAKDPKRFPGFDEAVVSDLRDLARAVPRRRHRRASRPISASCCWREYLYLNGRLARFYGVDLPPDAPFQKVDSDAGRAGRRPDAPLPDGDLRLHGVELADPSRGVPVAERAGPVAAAAAGGRRPAGRRPPPGPDHPPARRRSRPSPSRASRATA